MLLGVCRSCVCSREWIPCQVSLEGMDTLVRILVVENYKVVGSVIAKEMIIGGKL